MPATTSTATTRPGAGTRHGRTTHLEITIPTTVISRPCGITGVIAPGRATWATTASTSAPGISSCSTRTSPTGRPTPPPRQPKMSGRSEEHTSELQSHSDLVCRLLLEKKKQRNTDDDAGDESY